MRISIVTPAFNQGKFIEEAILSVRNQGYPDYEHIIVDGGSADGTIEILKKYPHLNWISELDEGQADALNKGFKMATGEIIGWLNADDAYLENTLEIVARFFQTHSDVALTYGYVYVMDEQGRTIRKRYSPDFDFGLLVRTGMCYAQPTFFFRRSVLEQVGYLDASLRRGMDYDFILKVGQKLKVQKIPRFLGRFRTHIGSMSHSGVVDPREREIARMIQQRYFSSLGNKYGKLLYKVRDNFILYGFKVIGRILSVPLQARYWISKSTNERDAG